MSERVREILSWYGSDNPGTLTNLARMLNHGRLGGTGKMVILPVDQGFEHGPARSFAPNPAGYDPRYHFELGVAAGCNAYAAPLGFLEAGAAEFAGEIPLILKLNNSDSLTPGADPCPAITGSVDEALRLGCVAIGFTIYPASTARNEMYGDLRALTEEAKRKGLAVVVWSYPRGSGISKEGETAIDVVAYAAQIACQLGAHVIKVKPPTAHIEQAAAKKVYEKEKIPVGTLAERVRHVVQSAFDGRRIVIFSGGEAKGNDAMFDEVRAHPRRRRLRLDHRPQLVPAAEEGRAQVPRHGHGHLRGEAQVSGVEETVRGAVARVPARRRGRRDRLRAHDGAGRAPALGPRRRRGDAQVDGHAADARHDRHRRGRARRGADAVHRREGRARRRRRPRGRHRRRSARGHQPLRHRRARRDRRAGRVQHGRPPERARLLHGEDHRRAGGARPHRHRRAGGDEPEGHRPLDEPRRRAIWWSSSSTGRATRS